MIYLQVTRGAADRDFAWPKDAVPGFVAFTQARPLVDTASAREGIKVISVPDIRWARRDIKTVQLLAPSWCKMMAKKAGKDDAWMVEDGLVTEGTSNNAYIVTADGAIVTRDLSQAILHGITRAAVLRSPPRRSCASRNGPSRSPRRRPPPRRSSPRPPPS